MLNMSSLTFCWLESPSRDDWTYDYSQSSPGFMASIYRLSWWLSLLWLLLSYSFFDCGAGDIMMSSLESSEISPWGYGWPSLAIASASVSSSSPCFFSSLSSETLKFFVTSSCFDYSCAAPWLNVELALSCRALSDCFKIWYWCCSFISSSFWDSLLREVFIRFPSELSSCWLRTRS